MKAPRLRVASALAALRRWRAQTNAAPATIRAEQRALARLLPRLGAPLARARRVHVAAYLAARAAEVGPATRARELSSLRALYRLLRRERLVRHDPTEGLSLRAWTPRLPLCLSEQAVGRLLAEASRPPRARRSPALCLALALRNRAALELLYALGLRASELCGARLLDLDLAQATLLVRRAKRGPSARLPLPPMVLPHLAAYLAHARPLLVARADLSDGRLLANERGRPLSVSHLERLLLGIAARVDLAAHPHAFRRALATALVRRGAPLPAVQLLLGHKRLETTQRYVTLGAEDLRAAIDALERARSRAGAVEDEGALGSQTRYIDPP